MLKVKSAENAAAKFVNRAAVAGPDYEAGVRGTTDWEQKAVAGKDNYVAGLQASIARGSREKGIQAAGNAGWQTKAVQVGAQRFPTGVRAAQQDYKNKVSPYLETLRALDLPPKGPKGSPENYDRVRAVGEALHGQKVSQ